MSLFSRIKNYFLSFEKLSWLKELAYLQQQRKLMLLFTTNLYFILGRRVVTIYLPTESHTQYIKNLIERLQADPQIHFVIIRSKPSSNSNSLSFRKSSKLLLAHLHVCCVAEVEYCFTPSFAETVNFPHSLLSIFCEPSHAFRGFDYIMCPSRPFYNEILAHIEGTSTQALPCYYERLAPTHDSAQVGDELALQPKTSSQQVLLICFTRGDIIDQSQRLVTFISEALKNYNVIYRPHPLDFETCPQLIEAIRKNFEDHANFELDRSRDVKFPMARADIFVSDWSGSAVHFALIHEKPVLQLNSPYPYSWGLEHKPKVMRLFEYRLEEVFRRDLAAIFEFDGDITPCIQEARSKLKNVDKFKKQNLFSLTLDDNYSQILKILGIAR